MSTPPPPRPMRRSSIGQAAKTEAANPPNLTAVPDEQQRRATDTTPAGTDTATPEQTVKDVPPPQNRNKRIAGESRDILLTMPGDEKTRMVNTVTNTAARTGIIHQSKFIRFAVSKLCDELEKSYNNGLPFEPPPEAPL